jgi:hypothetical protein
MQNYKEVWDLGFNYQNSENGEFNLNIENLFEYCYELDENEIPARYKLKHLDKTITGYDPKVDLGDLFTFFLNAFKTFKS